MKKNKSSFDDFSVKHTPCAPLTVAVFFCQYDYDLSSVEVLIIFSKPKRRGKFWTLRIVKSSYWQKKPA